MFWIINSHLKNLSLHVLANLIAKGSNQYSSAIDKRHDQIPQYMQQHIKYQVDHSDKGFKLENLNLINESTHGVLFKPVHVLYLLMRVRMVFCLSLYMYCTY